VGKREEELIKQLAEHQDDPEEWENEPADVVVRAKTSHVISFRVSLEELEEITTSAEHAGETLSEFIRSAVALRIKGRPIGPAVEVMSGGGTLRVRSHILGSGFTENASLIPDVAPRLVSVGPNG
jgi:hypothetical protein